MKELALRIRSCLIQATSSQAMFDASQPNVRSAAARIPVASKTGVSFVGLHPNRGLSKTPPIQSPPRQKTAATRGPRETNKTILVVDDVPDVTEMIALFLKHAGFEVMTANSAESALKLTAGKSFDLIISDIGMPAMNGYELAESLRNQAQYAETPLIAVTGYTEYDDRGRSLRAGFNAHLTKPINPSQLLSLIGELLD